MTITNRPGDGGEGTDPNGVRRPGHRSGRPTRSSSDPRYEGAGGPRPRTRPVRSDGAGLPFDATGSTESSMTDALAALDSTTPVERNGDVGGAGQAGAPHVDLAALATSAVPMTSPTPSGQGERSASDMGPNTQAIPVVEPSAPTAPVPSVPVVTTPTPPPPVRVVRRSEQEAERARLEAAQRSAAAPVPVAERVVAEQRNVIPRKRRRPRVRRVRRIIRSIDTWTVFKVSTLFYLVVYAVCLISGVLLWNLAYATGTIENIQEFFTDFGWESFAFEGPKIFRAAWQIGLFMVVGGVGFNVMLATVFNLITELVGGIGVTVLEEEVRISPVANPRRRGRVAARTTTAVVVASDGVDGTAPGGVELRPTDVSGGADGRTDHAG